MILLARFNVHFSSNICFHLDTPLKVCHKKSSQMDAVHRFANDGVIPGGCGGGGCHLLLMQPIANGWQLFVVKLVLYLVV